MNITIGKPCAISEKGSRSNNEDSLYPLSEQASTSQKLFMVCDGVGGAAKGEVASSLACDSMQTFFATFLEGDPTPDFIRRALRYTESCFDTYISEHPESKGMGTTLTLAYIGASGITLAHVGDSRIYYVRDGKILFRTEDHSLVSSLVRLGQITSEEARTHRQKNVILRAIQGTHSPTEADVIQWQDIHPGDFLFLCTDGVLEQLTDERIATIFHSGSTILEIKDAILDACDGKTRDNYSFYVIPILKVHDAPGLQQNILSFLYSFV